jgi:kynurenine formamidase
MSQPATTDLSDLGSCRLIDLTRKLFPGREERRLVLRREVLAVDDTFMCEIDTMSHIGTHVECPAHFYETGGKGVADYPLERFSGRAVLFDLAFTAPRADLTAADLEHAAAGRLRPDDIAVLTSGRALGEWPHLTVESATWLRDQQIKLLAIDDTVSLGKTVAIGREVHDVLMGVDIPFVEMLTNLDQIGQPEFFFAAWPWPVEGLDSSPVRAVAFVPQG